MFHQPPIDEQLHLSKMYEKDLIEGSELGTFKFVAGFYLTVLQRASNKQYYPSMINILKAYMNKSYECSSWFLYQFCNIEIFTEQLLQSNQKVIRRFVAGLIYCAMLKCYEQDKGKLNLYWTEPESRKENLTVIGNLMLILMKHLFLLKKYVGNFLHYFQLIARFSSLGKEAREFLLRCRLIGRFYDFFYEQSSPFKSDFRNYDDLQVFYNESPDIGLPTVVDAKKLSYFQEMMEKRKEK